MIPCPALAGQGIKAVSCKPGPQLLPRGTVRLSSSSVCLLLFPRSAAASQAFCAAKPCRRADSFRPEENEIQVPCPAKAGQGIKAASCKPGPQLLPRGAVKLQIHTKGTRPSGRVPFIFTGHKAHGNRQSAALQALSVTFGDSSPRGRAGSVGPAALGGPGGSCI